MFKAALFTIAKIWKQPIWQSTDKWIKTWYLYTQGFPVGSNGKESACNAGDLASITGLGRSPEEGNGYPHQYSGLENSMDRGAWQATVHVVPKGLTRLQCGRPGFDPFIYIEHYWFTIMTAILPFLQRWTWSVLSSVKKSDRERYTLYVITHMWNLKNKANEFNKTEADSQIKRTNLWLPVGRGK